MKLSAHLPRHKSGQIFNAEPIGSEQGCWREEKLAEEMNLTWVEKRNEYFHDRPACE